MLRTSVTGLVLAGLCLAASPTVASARDGGADGASIETLTSVRVASGLGFAVQVTHAPGDYTRLYIVEKPGVIKVLNLKTGLINPTVFMNIDSIVGGGTTVNNEQGLLGLVFHPDFQTNRYFFVNYTNNSGNTVVARYTAIDGDTADIGSAMTVMTFAQPYSNHNGGWLGFGPNDGYLHIATGDGGLADDPGNRAQDITDQRLGKLLRVDVNGDDFPADAQRNYAIPPSNPFVGEVGDDEIWAYGLRNPWRCSFDRATGDLYIGDVGQNAIEELDFQRSNVPGGRNYGWRCYEGNNAYITGGCAPASTMTFPFHTYNHSTGISVISGYVYRGCAIPTLENTYFFADYGSNQIWSVNGGGGTVNFTNRTTELTPDAGVIQRISSFGEDAAGEIYVVDQGTGTTGEVFRIVAAVPTISPADIDCNGEVGFSDLLSLLSVWGPCDGCREDLSGDGVVGFDDLLELLSLWG